jgi:hypothetical protein
VNDYWPRTTRCSCCLGPCSHRSSARRARAPGFIAARRPPSFTRIECGASTDRPDFPIFTETGPFGRTTRKESWRSGPLQRSCSTPKALPRSSYRAAM